MTVIELGESPREPMLDEAPPPRRPYARWLSALAVLALVVGTMAAAGPAPRPLPEAIVAAPLGAAVIIADGRLFVIDPITSDPAQHQPRTLAAFRLPGATTLARVPLMLPIEGPTQVAGRVDDILLLARSGDTDQEGVVAVNGLTGAIAWQHDARFEGLTTTGNALFRAGPDGAEGQPAPAGVVTAVDVRTGAVRWSYRYPAGTARSARYDPVSGQMSMLVDHLSSGRLELRDAGTGQVTGGRDLPPQRTRADPDQWYPEIVGDLVLIHDLGGTLTAYQIDGLDRRWTISIGIGADQPVWPRECGPVLCLYGPQGVVGAVDPGTGRTLWSTNQLSDATPYAGRLIGGGQPDPAGDGRTNTVNVLDPWTGRVLAELGRWQVVGPAADGHRLYGVRYGTYGRAWVAELNPQTGSTVVLGRLDRVSADCQAQSDVLVCRRLDGSLGVWNLAG